MRKLMPLVLALLFACSAFLCSAEESYDPQNTMQALNMAIASVHRIISTQDKNVLTQEYKNIINNLKQGNIEADYELVNIYKQLLDTMSKKTIRQEEARRIQLRYEKNAKRAIYESLSGIRAYGGDWKSFLFSFATSCFSQYFSYQNLKEDLNDRYSDEMWSLEKSELEDINDIQKELLSSSWRLMRQYKFSDNYRLIQDDLDTFYKALSFSNSDSAKRLRLLKEKSVAFAFYPPYWLYRAKAAQDCNDMNDAQFCYNKFDEVWRPIFRKDPFKQEVLKYRITEAIRSKSYEKQKVINLLNLLREYTNDYDWSNKIFIGLTFYYIDEKVEAINSIQSNIDLMCETEISEQLIEQIEADTKDLSIGAINYSAFDNPDNKCPECNGLGKISRSSKGYSFTCKKCGGTGRKDVVSKENIPEIRRKINF